MRARITGRFAAVADYELEAYLCAELSPARRAAVELAAQHDPALSAYLAERAQARDSFAASHPLRLDSAAAGAAATRAARSPWWQARAWLLAATAAAPALALALWWAGVGANATAVPAGRNAGRAFERDAVRIKGNGLAVELYVKRGERVFRPRADEALEPGDRVRVQVETASAGYLSLLARDERGAVSVYYDRLPVQPGRFTAPDSLLLDSSSSDEQWLVLLASEARPASDYARAFAQGKAVDAAHLLLTLHKEKP